jgi:hypothetical protein
VKRSNHTRLRNWGNIRPRIALGLLIAVVAVSTAVASASASRTLPLSPTYLDATTASNALKVEPQTITYTGDGTGFLGGAVANSDGSSIHWTKWTRHVALGSGFNQLNNCSPSCAGGTFHGYRVKIEVWRPRTLAGTLVFTRMTIFYQRGRPRGEPRHYTFTDSYRRDTGGYSWGPPTAQSYCVHTHGLAPFAGCKNIHSLP